MNKIERVKELLIYDELNLTEIAYKLHYSSVAHLSNQFKKNNWFNSNILQAIERKEKVEFRKSVVFNSNNLYQLVFTKLFLQYSIFFHLPW